MSYNNKSAYKQGHGSSNTRYTKVGSSAKTVKVKAKK